MFGNQYTRHGRGPGGRCRSFGPGGPEFAGMGFGGPRGRGRGRGGRARRGDFRTAALLLLAEEPRNGYQLMQEVQERSGGLWSPSPGSVYPALSQLEDEGLIRSEEQDGRRVYAITDAGRAAVEERGEGRQAPWEEVGGDVSEGVQQLGRLMRELAGAFVQVMKTGSESQISKAQEVLDGARRDLYRILADGAGEEQGKASDS